MKLQDFFAEYHLFYRALWQKRPIILRSLLTVDTPYVSTYVYINTHIKSSLFLSFKRARTHTHMHTYTHIYTQARTHTYTPHTQTHTNSYTYTWTRTRTKTHANTHTHTLTHTHTRAHMYTHTYIQTQDECTQTNIRVSCSSLSDTLFGAPTGSLCSVCSVYRLAVAGSMHLGVCPLAHEKKLARHIHLVALFIN